MTAQQTQVLEPTGSWLEVPDEASLPADVRAIF